MTSILSTVAIVNIDDVSFEQMQYSLLTLLTIARARNLLNLKLSFSLRKCVNTQTFKPRFVPNGGIEWHWCKMYESKLMCDELELTANIIVRDLLAKKFSELSKLPVMDQADCTVVIDAITAKIIGLPSQTTTL